MHSSISLSLCEHNLENINSEIVSKYVWTSNGRFFLRWLGSTDLSWTHPYVRSAGGLAGIDFAVHCALLHVWGRRWENGADSAPCSVSSSSRLAWAPSHGRSQGLQRARWSMQGLLRPGLETPMHYFCHITSVKESHVASSDYRSRGIIPPLYWRGSKVTLQHGVHMKRGIIVNIFCKQSVYGTPRRSCWLEYKVI